MLTLRRLQGGNVLVPRLPLFHVLCLPRRRGRRLTRPTAPPTLHQVRPRGRDQSLDIDGSLAEINPRNSATTRPLSVRDTEMLASGCVMLSHCCPFALHETEHVLFRPRYVLRDLREVSHSRGCTAWQLVCQFSRRDVLPQWTISLCCSCQLHEFEILLFRPRCESRHSREALHAVL